MSNASPETDAPGNTVRTTQSGQPAARTQAKKVTSLDDTARSFIASSPFVLLGTAGAFFARPDSRFAVAWQGLNLWAAMVHYAFDGMIWKLRRPETAAALGVTS